MAGLVVVAVLAVDWALQRQEYWRRYYAANETDSRASPADRSTARVLRFEDGAATTLRPTADPQDQEVA